MEKINRLLKKGGHSIALKALLIGVLILILTIPLFMISSLIHERKYTRMDAENEIINRWGGEPTIGGPVLTVPYIDYEKDEKGGKCEVTRFAHFLPDFLSINGHIKPEKRNLGIYEVTLYTADLHIKGSFKQPDFSEWRIPESNIFRNEAFLSIEFPDMRAIREKMSLSWDGIEHEFKAGAGKVGIYGGEIWTPVSLSKLDSSDNHVFTLDLKLKGGRSLGFLPLGGETQVHLTSSWPSPGFTGAFLPETREFSKQGFIYYIAGTQLSSKVDTV